MRRFLVATTCLTPFAIVFASQAASAASVSVTGTQTTPILSSTASSGTAADVSIASGATLSPAAGTAVTIDSANSVTNAGTITITGADNSAGIVANAGQTGAIANSGTITVNETYTQTDTNGDGVVDGVFAEGTNRFGIQTLGALTGDVTNSGTITVKGNNSAGIALGGTLTGSLSQSGTITVTGDNSNGITTGAVTGNVGIAGTVTATGANASAVLLGGAIGGTLTVQATLTSTGYTSTTLPATQTSLGADNLLQNGPTLQVAGSVAGGMIFTAATSTTDSSGTAVTTTAATITSFGSAAAVQIGSASQPVTIGVLAADTNGYGFDMNGTVSATGVYDGVAAHALVIGGLGGAVSIAGGASITGTISAASNDASATAIEIGSGATVPILAQGGTISAVGAATAGQTSTALLIDAGATAPTITNSGTLTATSSSTSAAALAFADRSGTVTQFTNSGTITASGGASNVALDLSTGSQAVTVTQAAPSSGTSVPSITGDILFGSGNDTLAASAGKISGNVSFGGTGTIALSGTATLTGNADFGNHAGLFSLGTGSAFTGALNNAGGVALTVAGGTLSLSNTGAVALSSLTVSNGGTLGVQLNGSTGAATDYLVAGSASFAVGSTIALHFANISSAVGTYALVQAGTLTGAGNVSVDAATLPYLFSATLAQTTGGTGLDLSVAPKTAAQLGLNRAATAAYQPILAAISGDTPLGDSFLTYTNAASLTRALSSMLPDYAGGTFKQVSLGSRQSARWLEDPAAPMYQDGRWGAWIQQVGWLDNKSTGDTAGYRLSGWGVSAGGEYSLGKIGRIGISGSFLTGNNDTKDTSNSIRDDQYELGVYWRADWGGLHAFARGSVATIRFHDDRQFAGSDDGTAFTRTAQGAWTGKMESGLGGLSYQIALGAFSLRPQASIDYYHLREPGYAETGGGVGYDLLVDTRTSNELAANGSLVVGYRIFQDETDDSAYMRVELEGGRRAIIGGTLGATTASFAGGQAFTLVPDADKGGWTGALRLKGGNSGFTASGEVDGQREDGGTAVAIRAGVQMSF